MNLDIQGILDRWPYKPGEVNVRRIMGDDGKEKIQLRLDLGMLQMEVTGRPDGRQPHGYTSLLEYYRAQLDRHRDTFDTETGFVLDDDACEQLRTEGVMYYHRYLAEFVLGDYEAVLRDTTRNLDVFDFILQYAEREEDRLLMEQYRPYVLMMQGRAKSRAALKQNHPSDALSAIREAVGKISAFYIKYGQDDAAESSTELSVLHALESEIKAMIPVDPGVRLQRQLTKALAEERYEDAAAIRDQISQLKQENNSNTSTNHNA